MGDTSAPPEPGLAFRFANALGLARGIWRSPAAGPRPEHALELYGFEGCPGCRRVRVVLSELDLDYLHRSCPKGPSRNRERLARVGGKTQVPFLVDPNTGAELYESRDIVAYLFEQYGS